MACKKGEKVKSTHTVFLEREKSIDVSSTLNAYQAIDILLKNLKKQKAADKTESNEGYYLAGGLSLNTSGITVRDIESVVTWRWNYAACFSSTIPPFTLLCNYNRYNRQGTEAVWITEDSVIFEITTESAVSYREFHNDHNNVVALLNSLIDSLKS